jgi:hypothetical protein
MGCCSEGSQGQTLSAIVLLEEEEVEKYCMVTAKANFVELHLAGLIASRLIAMQRTYEKIAYGDYLLALNSECFLFQYPVKQRVIFCCYINWCENGPYL